MDISLIFRSTPIVGQFPLADIAMDGPDLQTGDELQTAVTISLFTDRRAEPDDEPTIADRRGFWGDTYSAIEDDRIGSRLWLLERQKETQQILNFAKIYCQEALQWLLDDEVVEDIQVETEFLRKGVLGIKIKIQEPEGSQEFNYSYTWNKI